MTPDTKKKICELAGVEWEPSCENIACSTFCEGFDDERQCCGDMEITLDILMRAVFAINRKRYSGHRIIILDDQILVDLWDRDIRRHINDKNFYFKDYGHSEIQALTAAVEYVIGEMKR
jgi:hypothetical protein